jgi:hypothetical protein
MGRKRGTWKTFPPLSAGTFLEACGLVILAIVAVIASIGGGLGLAAVFAWKYVMTTRKIGPGPD